jgi:hypothetical protein
MNLDALITQLKTVTIFNGNVAGAAEYEKGVQDQAWLNLPAAYVIPLDDEPGENLDLSDSQQISVERIGVIVVFSNADAVALGDRRGQAASSLFEPTKWAIFKALINWRPDSSVENPTVISATDPGADHAARGLYYAGGRLIGFDLARLFYQWDFALEVTITDDDGWKATGVPLNEADFRITGELIWLTTNAITAAGSPVLHLGTAPAIDIRGYGAKDRMVLALGVIPADTTVLSVSGTTVTLSANVLAPGIGNGDVIEFYPVLAGENVALPQ